MHQSTFDPSPKNTSSASASPLSDPLSSLPSSSSIPLSSSGRSSFVFKGTGPSILPHTAHVLHRSHCHAGFDFIILYFATLRLTCWTAQMKRKAHSNKNSLAKRMNPTCQQQYARNPAPASHTVRPHNSTHNYPNNLVYNVHIGSTPSTLHLLEADICLQTTD